jgi:hypothetical protein
VRTQIDDVREQGVVENSRVKETGERKILYDEHNIGEDGSKILQGREA